MIQNFIFASSIALSCPRSNRKRSRFPSFIAKASNTIGGIEGGTPPSVGGQGTNRFLVNLWILSYEKKVSPGCRGGEPPCKRNMFPESKLRTDNISKRQLTKTRNFSVGLRSPLPRQLEAGHCSPTAQRQIVYTMIQNFIFAQSIYHLQHPIFWGAVFSILWIVLRIVLWIVLWTVL